MFLQIRYAVAGIHVVIETQTDKQTKLSNDFQISLDNFSNLFQPEQIQLEERKNKCSSNNRIS
jgi:hypothetical protein